MSGTSGAEAAPSAEFMAGYEAALEGPYCARCGRHEDWTGEYAPGVPCMGCGRYPAATVSPPPEVAAVLAEVARESLLQLLMIEYGGDPADWTGMRSLHRVAEGTAEAQAAALTAAGLVGGGTREVSDG